MKVTGTHLFLCSCKQAYQGHELSDRTAVLTFYEPQFLLKRFPPVLSGENSTSDQVEPVT